MALNKAKMKKRLEKLQEQNTTRKLLWKAKPGKHHIRIVPYLHDKENPFQELYFHYGLNGKTYLSPISVNEDDPIAEFAQELKESGDKEKYKLSRNLTPKLRIYVPIIIRGEEEEGVKFWGFGKRIYEQLLGLICDDDGAGDITDPTTGRDIIVEAKSAKETGQTYGSTSIRPTFQTSKLAESGTILKKILMEQEKLIPDIFKVPDYEDLKEELRKYLEGDNEEETVNNEENQENDDTSENDESQETTTEDDPDEVLKQFESMVDGQS